MIDSLHANRFALAFSNIAYIKMCLSGFNGQ